MDGNPGQETRDTGSADGGSGAADHEEPTPTDTVLSAVANEHRRAVLAALDDTREKTLGYDVLVDRVAERLRDTTDPASDERRQRVRIALHHTHLPKLEAARMIDYEAETGRVRSRGGGLGREILTLVESYDGHE